MGDFRLKF